jgi:sulfur carrier protein ThiS
MNITVKLGGPLRLKVMGLVDGERRLTLPAESRVTAALAALGLVPAQVRVAMRNGRPIRGDEALAEGDRLALFPPELAYNNYVAINFRAVLTEAKDEGHG